MIETTVVSVVGVLGLVAIVALAVVGQFSKVIISFDRQRGGIYLELRKRGWG